MFARVFALLPLALLVSAARKARDDSSECNTGSIQCCTSQSASQASSVLAEYGLADILDADSLVGTDCSAFGLVSVGNGCTAQQEPVCCQGNTFDGLVNIGCSPINISL